MDINDMLFPEMKEGDIVYYEEKFYQRIDDEWVEIEKPEGALEYE